MTKIGTGSQTVPDSRKIGPSQIVKQGWIYQLPCLQVKPDVTKNHHTIKPGAKLAHLTLPAITRSPRDILNFVDNN